MGLLRKLWNGWKSFALWLGHAQTVLLLSICYYLTIGPTSVVARILRQDFLRLRRPNTPSYWADMPHTTTTMEQARRQF